MRFHVYSIKYRYDQLGLLGPSFLLRGADVIPLFVAEWEIWELLLKHAQQEHLIHRHDRAVRGGCSGPGTHIPGRNTLNRNGNRRRLENELASEAGSSSERRPP